MIKTKFKTFSSRLSSENTFTKLSLKTQIVIAIILPATRLAAEAAAGQPRKAHAEVEASAGTATARTPTKSVTVKAKKLVII